VVTTGEETSLVHGSGLGLWLVYYVVDSLNGRLCVREAESGTRVAVRLAAASDSADADE
jgi:signal transduction histidine kinase